MGLRLLFSHGPCKRSIRRCASVDEEECNDQVREDRRHTPRDTVFRDHSMGDCRCRPIISLRVHSDEIRGAAAIR